MKEDKRSASGCLMFIALLAFIAPFTCPQAVQPAPLLHDYTVAKKIEWAKTDLPSLTLTMDIYTPATGKTRYPILVIYHGGGWLINTNAIMDSMAIYMVRHTEMVVCNVNYRLLKDRGNTITMNQIVEDALGAIAWIKEHISAYQGDSTKIIVTGDSAGGHLAAMVLLCSDKLEGDGYKGATLGFCPTWLPPGKTAEELASTHALAVQGAILSYSVFDIYALAKAGIESSSNIFWALGGVTPRKLFGPSYSHLQNPDMYKAVSPIYNIPPVSDRLLPPQLCLVGSRDTTTPPVSIKAYVDSTQNAGQRIEYWEYAGQPHAFLDATPNTFLGTQFTRDAPPALDKMIAWLQATYATAAEHTAVGKHSFALSQNYPNPFNGVTQITYSLDRAEPITLKIYDVNGREVAVLWDGLQNAGRHAIRFDAGRLASGLYFSRLSCGSGRILTKRMVLIK
jgi:acetyl esterase/lipase